MMCFLFIAFYSLLLQFLFIYFFFMTSFLNILYLFAFNVYFILINISSSTVMILIQFQYFLIWLNNWETCSKNTTKLSKTLFFKKKRETNFLFFYFNYSIISWVYLFSIFSSKTIEIAFYFSHLLNIIY